MSEENKVVKGAVQRALERQLFGQFDTRRKVMAIGTTPVVILQNNPERIGFVMVNAGIQQITFDLIRDVVSGIGYVLPSNGDTVSTSYVEDGVVPTHEFSAVSAAAGGSLFITEFIRTNIGSELINHDNE